MDKFDYTPEHRYNITKGLFAMTCAFFGIPMLALLLGFLLYYCKWEKEYHKRGGDVKRRGDEEVLGWNNPNIKKIADSSKIQVME